MKKFSCLLLLALTLASCSQYQKALKSDDVALKYAQAEEKYNQGKHSKALRLFEQLAPNYKGKPQAEKMFYMFAQSYFQTKQYYLAGYQFDAFVAGYPKSEKAEEAMFLGAKCYSLVAPVYSLDQVDTYKAIEKFQVFFDRYPNSNYAKEANDIVQGLQDKLERKAFEIANNYHRISDFKSAIVCYDNFLGDYPGTKYKEKALYYKLDSSYQLAINSIPSKMEERLNNAKAAYSSLMKFNASTEFKKEADEKLAKIENDLKQFSK